MTADAQRLDIAVVGAGIAGLACAWLLSKAHNVTLIEKDERLGGHANTVDVDDAGRTIGIDTGFIVYNTACYPNLIALFDHLGVETAPTRMGFAVSLDGGNYEYCGTGLQGLFGQPANLFKASHLVMVGDILRFFRDARRHLAGEQGTTATLGDWLATHGYSSAFVDCHIRPMAAAIWSTPGDQALHYPVTAFLRFFANHGLLQVRHRPQWRTVAGGSQRYVERLRGQFNGRVIAGDGVRRITRTVGGVDVRLSRGEVQRFDQVVLACHANEALEMLGDATAIERQLLSAFRYQANEAVLHRDTSQMPRRRRLWSSWNYIGGDGRSDRADGAGPSVTYWMNALQPLPTTTDYFVTLNPAGPIDTANVVSSHAYDHPLFDAAALAAQRRLWQLQGARHTWFAGSYVGAGFHEDALQAGLWVGEQLGGVRRPWSVAGENDRLPLAGRACLPMATEVAA